MKRPAILLVIGFVSLMTATGCATPARPATFVTPTNSMTLPETQPPYPLPATYKPVVPNVPTPTATVTAAAAPSATPTRRLVPLPPTPPDPSRIPTYIGTPPTVTPRPGEVRTPPLAPPTFTPYPITKITDKAPELADEDKAHMIVRHADGTYELFLLGPGIIEPEKLLLPGDKMILLSPPLSLMKSPPRPPTILPLAVPSPTRKLQPYP